MEKIEQNTVILPFILILWVSNTNDSEQGPLIFNPVQLVARIGLLYFPLSFSLSRILPVPSLSGPVFSTHAASLMYAKPVAFRVPLTRAGGQDKRHLVSVNRKWPSCIYTKGHVITIQRCLHFENLIPAIVAIQQLDGYFDFYSLLFSP